MYCIVLTYNLEFIADISYFNVNIPNNGNPIEYESKIVRVDINDKNPKLITVSDTGSNILYFGLFGPSINE